MSVSALIELCHMNEIFSDFDRYQTFAINRTSNRSWLIWIRNLNLDHAI